MKKFNLSFTCVLLSTALFLFSSCSDDDNSGEETKTTLIPWKLTSEDWEFTLEYDSQNRLIKKTETEKDGTYASTYEYDSDGRLIKETYDEYVTIYTYNKDSVFVEEIGYDHIDTLIINANNQIIKSKNRGTGTFEYNANGTLASTKYESQSSDGNYKTSEVVTYSYDNRKGAFSNVNILSWQFHIILENMALGHILNISEREMTYKSQYGEEENSDYKKTVLSYSYNADGYPVEAKLLSYDKNGNIDEEESETVSIQYIEKK